MAEPLTNEEFEVACQEVLRLANVIANGTPEQIAEHAESGWWDAMDTLNRVYSDWLMERA